MPENDNAGMLSVGLMALHDRNFFAHLLEDPAAAIAAKKKEGHLVHVGEEEVQMIKEAIRERMSHGGPDPLKLWDDYHLTGDWRPHDWPMEWGWGVRRLS